MTPAEQLASDGSQHLGKRRATSRIFTPVASGNAMSAQLNCAGQAHQDARNHALRVMSRPSCSCAHSRGWYSAHPEKINPVAMVDDLPVRA